MKPQLSRTLLLTFALGVIVGMLEGWGVLQFLGLGFGHPGLEMIGIGWRYGLLALGCLLIAWPLAILLRLPRKTPTQLALWAALGLAWIVGNWWVQGELEVLRDISITAPISLAWLAGTTAALFVLHFALVQFAKAAPGLSRALVVGLPLILIVTAELGYQASTGTDAPTGSAEEAAKQPDITIVVIDTLRADHLGTYGYEAEGGLQTSPIIDELAASGAVFENAWSQAPWTRPSMASLHSGLFCSGHAVNEVYNLLPDNAVTLAEMAHAKGYRTAGFSANANVSITYGFGQGFERLWTVGQSRTLASFTRWGEALHFIVNKVFNETLYDGADHADLVNQEVLTWLDEVQPDPRPKFTYVHYIDPHTPYAPPEGHFPFANGPRDLSPMGEFLKGRASGMPEYPFAAYPKPPRELINDVIYMYDAEIRYVDTEFGKLLAELRQRGLLDEGDWLILTSDHGEEFYERGRWGHGHSLFEDQVHVPLIVVGPDAPAATRQEQEVNVLDIHETVADILDFDNSAADTPSLSLRPLLDGAFHEDQQRILYAERLQGALQGKELRALRQDFRKIIEIPWAQDEDMERLQMWFDLRENPGEDLGIPIEDVINRKPIRYGDHPAMYSSVPEDLANLLKEYQLLGSKQGAVQAVGSMDEMKQSDIDWLIKNGYLDASGNPIQGVGHSKSGKGEKN